MLYCIRYSYSCIIHDIRMEIITPVSHTFYKLYARVGSISVDELVFVDYSINRFSK